MYFTSGSDRAFEQLMQGKPGFDHYDSGEAVTPEDCGTCRFYRPHWKYQFCVYAECPYQPGKLTAYDAVTFRVKGVENMAVFRVERNKGYTVMSNHHLRNKDLSLKAKGLLSQMLSLPEDWDYLCRANQFKPEQEYYLCSTYRKDRTLCSTHSIRRVVLEEIVLRNLREAIQYVTQYEDDFVQRAADQSLRERDKELAQKKDTLAQSQKRIAELDVIIKRLYEDNISGKLSDERFIKLSRDYELEQTNLTNLVEHLRQEVKEQEKQKVNVRQFIAAVRKYTDMQQLDASILREFVDKIYISEVYTPDENEPRIKVREIEIVYNFIGAFDFEEAREQSQAAQKEKKTGVA